MTLQVVADLQTVLFQIQSIDPILLNLRRVGYAGNCIFEWIWNGTFQKRTQGTVRSVWIPLSPPSFPRKHDKNHGRQEWSKIRSRNHKSDISYDMSVRFWSIFNRPLISDMSNVRVRQFMKFFSTDSPNGEILNMEKNMKQQNLNLESLYCKFSFQFQKDFL